MGNAQINIYGFMWGLWGLDGSLLWDTVNTNTSPMSHVFCCRKWVSAGDCFPPCFTSPESHGSVCYVSAAELISVSDFPPLLDDQTAQTLSSEFLRKKCHVMLFWLCVRWLCVVCFLWMSLWMVVHCQKEPAAAGGTLWGSEEFHMVEEKREKRAGEENQNIRGDLFVSLVSDLEKIKRDCSQSQHLSREISSCLLCSDVLLLPPISVNLHNYIFISCLCWFFSLSSANQPHSKVCMHAYLFPFPISHQTHNATEYDSAISKCHTQKDTADFLFHFHVSTG